MLDFRQRERERKRETSQPTKEWHLLIKTLIVFSVVILQLSVDVVGSSYKSTLLGALIVNKTFVLTYAVTHFQNFVAISMTHFIQYCE